MRREPPVIPSLCFLSVSSYRSGHNGRAHTTLVALWKRGRELCESLRSHSGVCCIRKDVLRCTTQNLSQTQEVSRWHGPGVIWTWLRQCRGSACYPAQCLLTEGDGSPAAAAQRFAQTHGTGLKKMDSTPPVGPLWRLCDG